MRITLLSVLILCGSVSSNIQAQDKGKALIISPIDCEITIDGTESYNLVANKPKAVDLTAGQHLVQFHCTNENEVIQIESGKQIVLQVESKHTKDKALTAEKETLPPPAKPEQITLTNLSVSIPGGLTMSAEALNGGDYESTGAPIFFYYLEKDDEVEINVIKKNKKGTNSINVYSYPDGNEIFSRSNFESLYNESLKIRNDGIYAFQLGTNYTFDRTLGFKLVRTPANSNYKSSKVTRKRKYDLVTIQEPASQWINSTSNEDFKGGTSRITIPVVLPNNTLEWYYVISATRDKEKSSKDATNINLLGQLAGTLASTSTASIKIALSAITAPPGTNYCSIYLFDNQNAQLFRAGHQFSYNQEGSRENVTNGKFRIKRKFDVPLLLGIQNKDYWHGIGVAVEIVAVTYRDFYEAVEGQ